MRFLALSLILAAALPAAAQVAFDDERGESITLETSNLAPRARIRTAAFDQLHELGPAAPGTTLLGAPAKLRADDFVDAKLASYAGTPGGDQDPSWALVGTGLVGSLLEPGSGAALRRLLSEPEMRPWLARASSNPREIRFVVDYTRARVRRTAGPSAKGIFTPIALVGRVTDLAVRGALQGQHVYTAGLDRRTPVDESVRLTDTIAYFRARISAGGHLHQAVQRWLIETRRLERLSWWHRMNGHIHASLGRSPFWKPYEAWFGPDGRPRHGDAISREKLYLAAHNDDLHTGLPQFRPLWSQMPWTERITADLVVAAALQGEKLLHLVPSLRRDRVHP